MGRVAQQRPAPRQNRQRVAMCGHCTETGYVPSHTPLLSGKSLPLQCRFRHP